MTQDHDENRKAGSPPENVVARLRHLIQQKLHLFTRAIVVVLIASLVGYQTFPELFAPTLTYLLGANFLLVVAIVLLQFSFERITRLEQIVRHPAVEIYDTKEEAYRQFFEVLAERDTGKIDLLEFSGATAVPFLKEVAKRFPKSKLRLLLMNEDEACAYDGVDGANFHKNRILATLGQVKLLQQDHKTLQIEIGYYNTSLGMSAIIADDRAVSVGWYTCFPTETEKSVGIRLRGHNRPAINATRENARSIWLMARNQFDSLWAVKSRALSVKASPREVGHEKMKHVH